MDNRRELSITRRFRLAEGSESGVVGAYERLVRRSDSEALSISQASGCPWLVLGHSTISAEKTGIRPCPKSDRIDESIPPT
jgi:hypothetical protein